MRMGALHPSPAGTNLFRVGLTLMLLQHAENCRHGAFDGFRFAHGK
jgi:hypothetical protein